MQSFEDLGLREELLRALEEEDITRPTALQESVIPPLRRGGNLVARASSGAGKTLAYGLGVLDRLAEPAGEAEPSGPRLLVVAPTTDVADWIGIALVPYAQALGQTAAVLGAAWGRGGDASVVVGTPETISSALSRSHLKLDALEALVIDDALSIVRFGDLEKVDGLFDLIPRDAQRVIVTGTFTPELDDLIDRRVKRALRYPAEPAIPVSQPSTPASTIGYLLATENQKLSLLASQLAAREPGGPPPVIFCRSDERAADLAEQLTIRGFLVGHAGEEDADVAVAAADISLEELLQESEADVGQTISFDVPQDARTLRARHSGDPDAVVLLEPRELAHLREIAKQANVSPNAAPLPPEHARADADLRAFRDDLRRAIEQEDLTAQMLVIEPLLEEFSPIEIAAAAAALLRSRPAARPQREAAPAPSPTTRPPRERAAPAGPAPVTWARLFVSIGSRDEVRPADLVGALAGEADIPGSKIGKIEIRDSFSIVEIQSDVADKVIRAVNGTTMKGRSLRVDYDRGGPARRPSKDAGPARRTSRRPPGA